MGIHDPNAGAVPLLVQRDQVGTWTVNASAALANGAQQAGLVDLSGTSSSDAWAGGTAYRTTPSLDDSGGPQLVAHCDGTTWTQAAPAQPVANPPSPGGVPEFATVALTVGPDGTLWTSEMWDDNFTLIGHPDDFVTTLPGGCLPQPPPVLPEAPWPWLLPVSAAVVGGGIIAARRRRPIITVQQTAG